MARTIFLLPLIAVMLMFSSASSAATAGDSSASGKVDVKKIIFEHVKDSYEWHITTIGDKHISISLPVILYSQRTGWEMFSSSRLHAGEGYNGFFISTTGDNEGKIVELDVLGNEIRPTLDISITKTVFAMLVSAVLLMVLVLYTARWYRGRAPGDAAPRGFVGVMEMLITMLVDDIIKPNIGKNYKRFTPYLLTAFFFIFLNNIMGIIPIFPGGANVTGNIAVTLALALCTFIAVNVFGKKEYYKEIFWPDVPVWLKLPVPILPAIELFGVFVKPFALTIRLFANILAGHTVILAIVCIIFITMAVNEYIGGTMTVVSFVFTIFMNCLELLVAFIQAFVFTMMSAVFIGLAQPEHDTDKH